MQPLDAERGLTDDAFRNFLPGNLQEDDKSLIVEFFVGKKLMGARSAALGREVYEDREFVKIMIKGQDKQIVVEEVKPHHKKKFPHAYMAFQQAKPIPVIGTPIEMMPGIGPSMAHTLKGLNLRSVEDLANVGENETVLQAIGMGARDLVTRAKAWIEKRSPAEADLRAQLEAEKKAREEAERKAAEDRAAFEARLAALEKPKRGRKAVAAA